MEKTVAELLSDSLDTQLQAAKAVRHVLSCNLKLSLIWLLLMFFVVPTPPIQEVIDHNMLPILVQLATNAAAPVHV